MSSKSARRAPGRASRGRQDRPARGSVPWFTALVVAVVLAAGVFGLRALGAFDREVAIPSDTPIPGSTLDLSQYPAGAKVGQQLPDEGNNHIPDGTNYTDYKSNPPTSGNHWNTPAAYGIYDTNPPPIAQLVHNLEHGAVVIYYNHISDADLAALRALRAKYPKDKYGEVKVIIRPYDRIPANTVALTAWTWLDTTQGYDEHETLAFLRAHLDQGPEDVQ